MSQQESFLLLINHLIGNLFQQCDVSGGGDDVDQNLVAEDTTTDDVEFGDTAIKHSHR